MRSLDTYSLAVCIPRKGIHLGPDIVISSLCSIRQSFNYELLSRDAHKRPTVFLPRMGLQGASEVLPTLITIPCRLAIGPEFSCHSYVCGRSTRLRLKDSAPVGRTPRLFRLIFFWCRTQI